jgi:peroxiredoxin
VDSTYALKEYKAKYGLPFTMLSDVHREVTKAYGVFMPAKNWANRAYFLIDREGVVRWAHVEEHPGLRRESRELLEAIRALG